MEPTSCGTCSARPLPASWAATELSTYLTYPAAHRQFCWAHFRRNLLSAQDLATTAAARRFCREALTLQRQLFRLWHRFRGDPRTRGAPLTRAQLVAKVLPIEKCLFALAERYVNAPDVKVSNLARALFVHHAHFFTFVHEEAVAPTNNVAERALRTAVQWRKIMFGNRSAEGERAVARLLTDAPICQDTRSGSQVCGLARSVVCHHALKDLAGEKAFETADDLPFGPPFSGASFDVVEGW